MKELDLEQILSGLSARMDEILERLHGLENRLSKPRQGASLKNSPKLISMVTGAELLGISGSSIRKLRCGTEDLHHIRLGDRVLLVRSEVEALVNQRIRDALTPRERAEKKLRIGRYKK